MKYYFKGILFVLILIFSSDILFAQQNIAAYTLNDNPNKIENKGLINFLPLFNKSLSKKGHSSPLAIGIETSALIYQQDFISNNLQIKTTTTFGQDIYAYGDSISQNTTAGELKAYVKPGIWIFPFLNIYGIIGYTSGRINPDLYIDGITIEDLPVIGDFPIDTSFSLNEQIQYFGNTYGFGLTFSMGFRNLVLLMDYHFTSTKPSDLDGKLKNHFFSPKIGVVLNTKSDHQKILLWVGAMYLSNNQSFTGEITVEEIAPELITYFGEKAEYSGNIETKNNWNTLVGGSITFKKHHNLFAEFGFINRLQTSIGYSFNF